jgi:hypothetical protein
MLARQQGSLTRGMAAISWLNPKMATIRMTGTMATALEEATAALQHKRQA